MAKPPEAPALDDLRKEIDRIDEAIHDLLMRRTETVLAVAAAKRESGDLTVGRMLINACKPYSWRDQFPKTNVFSPEERKSVETKWRGLLENLTAKRRPYSAPDL